LEFSGFDVTDLVGEPMKLAQTRIYAEAETAARGLVATAKAARAVRMEGYSGPAQPSPTIGR
jgi:hypothetical protein